MTTGHGSEAFVTARDVARHMGTSVDFVYRAVKQYGLPSYRLGNGPKSPRRFLLSEVDAWLRDRRDVA